MKRTALVLTASALSLAMSGAFAAGAGSQAQLDPANTYRASDLMNIQVKGSDDQDIGSLSELIVDKDGKVSHVVLQESGTLGMGDNKYVVPWDRVSITSPDEATIDVSSDQLSSEFAAFDEQVYEQQGQTEQRSPQQSSDQPMGGGTSSQ